MKKTLLALTALSCIVGCTKPYVSPKPYNTWTLGSTEYTATNVAKSTVSGTTYLTATAGSGTSTSTIGFYFSALPTVSGVYNIVGTLGGGTNDVYVITGSNVGGKTIAYGSTGFENMKASITVNSGKISITMPSITAKNLVKADSLKVSATAVTEP